MALTDEAILTIKQMIIDGELKPGDRLPPEKELGVHLGLSRNSLREAVKALEVIGVLDVRRGDGTYVTDLGTDYLTDAVSFILDLHQESSLLELFEVRRILEAAAVEKAAARITDQDILELEEQMQTIRQALQQGGATDTDVSTINTLVEHDIAFHQFVLNLADNSYLASLTDSLASHTTRVRIWRGLTDSQAVERTLIEHQAIVDALTERNPALARAVMTHHICGVERFIKETSSLWA
ncbi:MULTISPECIES: FadR/GntR family transcriptional regulator [Rothia]|uniref:GntR family transcriptional regulator n=1 Tax=Rothia nasimurium TaxID=85336 RepID=A0A1Y1RMK6_9MICC|nr:MULTISPECIES: FadR/GntR family transcriptional regulator [Rothia]ORC15757.1 GntR family transcriptional regulator [Rothia nasimurium]